MNNKEFTYLINQSQFHKLQNFLSKQQGKKKKVFDSINCVYFKEIPKSGEASGTLRLKGAGVPNSEQTVLLELFEQKGGQGNYFWVALSLEEANRLLKKGELGNVETFYGDVEEITAYIQNHKIYPHTYVAFSQMTYHVEGEDIVINKNLRHRRCDLKLEKGDYGYPLMEENTYLLAIDNLKALPKWLYDFFKNEKILRNRNVLKGKSQQLLLR